MEGDPDLFFDAVATSEETEVATATVTRLPQAIDEEVSGRITEGPMTFSMHSVVLLTLTKTMNQHWKMYHHLSMMLCNPTAS